MTLDNNLKLSRYTLNARYFDVMEKNNHIEIKTNKPLYTFLISSIFITFILFYIDEGNFNFDWMTNFGVWIVFFLYVLPIFLSQLMLFHWVFKRMKISIRFILSILLGIVIGFISVIGLIF